VNFVRVNSYMAVIIYMIINNGQVLKNL
jgi:hypothetical protein